MIFKQKHSGDTLKQIEVELNHTQYSLFVTHCIRFCRTKEWH